MNKNFIPVNPTASPWPIDAFDRVRDALIAFQAAQVAYGALENTEPKVEDVPNVITGEEDYAYYQSRLDKYNADRQQWVKDVQAASAALRQAKADLIAAIPVPNCWFKIDKIAVGYYLVYGGDPHVKVHPWTWDGMPKIHDR